MKKLIALFAASIMIAISANVMAQNTDTETATASAKLIQAIDIAKDADLNFGTIAKVPGSQTVTITATKDLGISYSEPKMAIPSSTPSVAQFTISGEDGALFSVNVPTTITMVSGSNTMDITTSKNLASTNNTLTGGSVELYVGGILTISESQATGTYSKEFDVTVSYE